jgi:hypothetical protein
VSLRSTSFLNLVLFAIGVIVLGWSIYSGVLEIFYGAYGGTVTGTVVMSSSGSRTRDVTNFEYAVAGKIYEGQATGLLLTPGHSVQVRYLKFSPSTSKLSRQRWVPMGPLALILGLFVVLISVRRPQLSD